MPHPGMQRRARGTGDQPRGDLPGADLRRPRRAGGRLPRVRRGRAERGDEDASGAPAAAQGARQGDGLPLRDLTDATPDRFWRTLSTVIATGERPMRRAALAVLILAFAFLPPLPSHAQQAPAQALAGAAAQASGAPVPVPPASEKA